MWQHKRGSIWKFVTPILEVTLLRYSVTGEHDQQWVIMGLTDSEIWLSDELTLEQAKIETLHHIKVYVAETWNMIQSL